jgi:phage gpG-like protein
MVDKFEKAITISLSSYQKNRALLPKRLGNEAVSHFKDNWKKQGYDDNGVTPWKQRKVVDSGRAILVKTGRLRRSFNMYPTFNRVAVINDTPYSFYNNYGTNKLPQRKFMGRSHNLDIKSCYIIGKMIKNSL